MFGEIAFGFMMILLIGGFAIFLGYVAWLLLRDIIFPPQHCTGEGTILRKWRVPTRKTTDLIDTTGGLFGMFADSSRTIPESWRVEVQVEGEANIIHVSKKLYDTLSVGESVRVSFMRGKNAEDIYFVSILELAA